MDQFSLDIEACNVLFKKTAKKNKNAQVSNDCPLCDAAGWPLEGTVESLLNL